MEMVPNSARFVIIGAVAVGATSGEPVSKPR